MARAQRKESSASTNQDGAAAENRWLFDGRRQGETGENSEVQRLLEAAGGGPAPTFHAALRNDFQEHVLSQALPHRKCPQ
jgi:hypothetical protein